MWVRRENTPFVVRLALSSFLGPIVTVGGFGARIVGGLLGCPFPLPFVMCHICPVPCTFRLIRPWLLGGVYTTGVLLGRAFCGLACPCGTVQDLLYRVPFRKVRARGAGRRMRYLKYGILIVSVGLVVELTGVWTGIPLVSGILSFMVMHHKGILVMGLVAVAIIMASSLFISRPWCRYLCPFGALISVFNKISLLSVKHDPGRCDGCRACERRCLVNLDIISGKDGLASAECVRCLECQVACKRSALRLQARFQKG